MEAFLAFDPHNYPFLIDHNSRFADVIARIAFKQGMLACGSKEAARRLLTKSDGEELSNIIVLLFAPYVAGLRALGDRTSSSNLLSEAVPDTRITYADHMDHIILHVTDSSSSSGFRSTKMEHRVVHYERSLFYYVELVKFAFGSNPMAARSDEVQRKLVRSLHRHWLSSHSSPVYLFEAMERLLVSANLKATLTLILQTVLSKCRSFLKLYGEVPSQALLYVNGKFTSEFATHCSNRLSKKDLILMQLLVECKCMPKSNRSALTSSKVSGGQSEDDDHSYYGDTESDIESGEACRSRRDSRNNGTVLMQSLADGVRPESLLHSSSFLLFMEGCKDIENMHTPYCVRTIKLTDNVVTVIVSELTTRFQARSIHSILQTLTAITGSKREFKGFEELHEFDRSCLHLKKLLDKNPSKTSKLLKHRINQLILSDVRKYCSRFSTNELPIKMEALISATCSCLRDYYQESVYLFELKRMRKVSGMDSVHDHTQRIQAFSQQQVELYIEYLEVKSKINMTIDPCLATLPGLKAFFYIDRKINTIVFAAADHKSREALPQAVAQSYSNLKSGALHSSFLVNDLTGHYFHWFEGVRGNTMKPSESNFVLDSFPCLIQSDFVNAIISKSFPCKRRDSFCCWGREAVSSFEILVLCKTSMPQAHSRANSISSNFVTSCSEPLSDIEVRCKRLASKLSEFIAPEHFVSTLF